MKEFFSENQAKEIWNQAAPTMSPERISNAYDSVNTFVVKSRRSAIMRHGAAFAAAVAICLSAGIFIGRTHQDPVEPFTPAYAKYLSPNGQVKEFTLSDGSHIYLNSGSRLTCAESFEGLATRDVFLSGEAFFEVAKDSEHPFIVHAAGQSIKVTGTKFNVRSFLDEQNSTIKLLEGGVEVAIPGQAGPIRLIPGQALSVSEDLSEISLYKVDPQNCVGWYKGEFNAYHMSLSQICRDLERRFDIKIMISNKNIAQKLFYASFANNEDADMILNALNVHHDFRIRKQDIFYTIY